MIKLALPVSQHFEAVKGTLDSLIDCYVFRRLEHLDCNFLGKECIYHTNGFVDDAFDAELNNEKALSKLKGKVTLLSFDIGPSVIEVALTGNGYVAQSPVLSQKETLDVMKTKLNHIRSYFAGRISLENLDYQPTGDYEHVCTAEFINEAVRSLNTGLTLDIGHLGVTCYQLKQDPFEYTQSLPLDRIAEVHLSRSNEGYDAHDLPGEREYELLDFILKRSNPGYITLEYYASPEGIIEGYKSLKAFLTQRGAVKS